MLFFKEPADVLENVNCSKNFFVSDYQNSYCFPVDELGSLFHVNVIECVNTGLLHLSSGKIKFGFNRIISQDMVSK